MYEIIDEIVPSGHSGLVSRPTALETWGLIVCVYFRAVRRARVGWAQGVLSELAQGKSSICWDLGNNVHYVHLERKHEEFQIVKVPRMSTDMSTEVDFNVHWCALAPQFLGACRWIACSLTYGITDGGGVVNHTGTDTGYY